MSVLEAGDIVDRVKLLPRGSVVVLLGGVDTGKSTLAKSLANAHLTSCESDFREGRVTLIDTDLGQGSLGLPGTVGAAMIEVGPRDKAISLGSYFVGDVNPVRHIRSICAGASHLLKNAQRRDPDLIFVDTCGLIQGRPGQFLKTALVDVLSPDVVLCLSRGDELSSIIKRLEDKLAPNQQIWQTTPPLEVGRKTHAFRRRKRLARFADALAGAGPRSFRIDGSARTLSGDLHQTLVGLISAGGDCLGIGTIEGSGDSDGTIIVNTSVQPLNSVRQIWLGSMRIGLDGLAGDANRPPVHRLPVVYTSTTNSK